MTDLVTQAKALLTDLATDLEKAADSVYRQQTARLRFAARAERLLGELVRLPAQAGVEEK